MTPRRSERELEEAVDRLDERGDRDLPVAGVITILSTAYNGGSVELLDRERRLVRIDGERHRATEFALEKFDESWWKPVTDEATTSAESDTRHADDQITDNGN